jgi:hypothetical protein
MSAKAFVNFYAILLTRCSSAFDPAPAADGVCGHGITHRAQGGGPPNPSLASGTHVQIYRRRMSTDEPNADGWVPQACTLPTAERSLRAAEFDYLFAAALHDLQRLDLARLRLTLRGSPGLEATARDLAARESECCSFFSFTVERHGEDVVVDVQVPEAHVEVLDGFTLDEVAALLVAGTHRHGRKPVTGLQAQAAAKLAEIEQKITDPQVIGNMR